MTYTIDVVLVWLAIMALVLVLLVLCLVVAPDNSGSEYGSDKPKWVKMRRDKKKLYAQLERLGLSEHSIAVLSDAHDIKTLEDFMALSYSKLKEAGVKRDVRERFCGNAEEIEAYLTQRKPQ